MERQSMPVPAPVEVPRFFVCPISLEVMRDPVTLSSGITYDRDSIEHWVFTDGHGDCPVTKLPLGADDLEPTPNHTLRRLIQAWCAAHAVERFPTPRPPVDADRVAAIVDGANRGGQPEQLAALRELADVVGESDRNRRCVEGAPGAVEFLVSVVKKHPASTSSSKPLVGRSQEESVMYDALDSSKATSPEEAALSILHSLKLSEETLKRVLDSSDDLVDTLASVLRWPSHRARTYGMHLLKAALAAMQPLRLSSASTELIEGVVRVVADRTSSPKAVKLAVHVICRLCPWGRNRIKAVEAGAMAALVELLLNEGCGGGSNGGSGKRAGELAAVAVDHLCACAEGRLELVAHPAGLAAVARAATRLSPTGTESAVRALHAVARHSATPAVLQEMLAVGVVAKLLYLVQAGAAGERPRERAREMLKMHARVWRGSPCLASHLASSYPC
ncbi:E3 ubiquitin-protein ligase PUB23 [Dichanthelium oligosanthes]|uniref:U-box domain-containing protein n=1 Tax=Dichanthelium oligosanthes TaxID=888268 RepID=A0A1E5VH43_9POAL|nr:E3 ubiquitin-protein ligase PUB23 [Dichanthelium oligosanthes]